MENGFGVKNERHYSWRMEPTPKAEQSPIEKRVSDLERQVAQVLGAKAPAKDWESTVGMWKDDELSREVDRLGAEWRKNATD